MTALGPSGTALYASLSRDGDPAELSRLITEAARIADRLDALDAAVSAEGLLRVVDIEAGVVEIRVNGPLAEARQQANTLRLLLADIARLRGPDTSAEDDDPTGDL